jgi:hypothetical protein
MVNLSIVNNEEPIVNVLDTNDFNPWVLCVVFVQMDL